jgi:hypothetical protein
MMDACTAKGAGKDDIGMVTSLFVISKVRQAYEMNRAPAWISAESWEASGGGPGEARVFGVTGLRIEPIKSGGEEPGPVRFRAAYTLWLPEEAGGPEEAAGLPGTALPRGVPRTDELTLDRVRGNWRITKILRVPR